MKKFLIIFLTFLYSSVFSIDPNLMYGLGSIKNVPAEYNPVIGLSFLKFGIISSWLESSDNDSVVRLTHELCTMQNNSLNPIEFSYLRPKNIGHLLKIIADHIDKKDQLKQAMIDYFKSLPELDDDLESSQASSNLLELIVEALEYINSSTVYPQGGVQSLFLGYLCAISKSREDIQSYYQGFLNDSNFILPHSIAVRKSIERPQVTAKKESKNYFCSIPQNKELEEFINSFANKRKQYDALQHLALLFFDFKDNSLVPNRAPSSLMNYIDASHLGAMMRIIDEYDRSGDFIQKLQDYLSGLEIINRVTGEFLNERSFQPLVTALSGSIILTQGKDAQYSYKFFKNILQGCICSRLNTNKDIENYCKGFFVHVTSDLIMQKTKEFSCCLNNQLPEAVEFSCCDNNQRPDQPNGKEEFHEINHDDLSDELVERDVLFGLTNQQSGNSMESIIFKLVKIARWQEKVKKENKQTTQPQTLQAYLSSVGGFYTIKNRKEGQKGLQQESESFTKFLRGSKNIPGIVYQRLETKKDDDTDLELSSQMLVVARGFKTVVPQTKDSDKKESTRATENSFDIGDKAKSQPKKYSEKNPKEQRDLVDTKNSVSIPKLIVAKRNHSPVALAVDGFSSVELLPTKIKTITLLANDKSNVLGILGNAVLVPASSRLVCAGMQPTVGNLVLGLNQALGLEIIPKKEIHLFLDPRVAVKYFDKICRKLDWTLDLSHFDLSKPINLNIGETKVVIDLNMQRKVEELSGEEKGTLLLPAALMKDDKLVIAPLQQPQLPLVKMDQLSVPHMPENLVAAMLVTGIVQAQSLKFIEAVAWVKNIQLILQAQRALFEFVSLLAPKPYERVMSKISNIMSSESFINNNLVGYHLINFFGDPENSDDRKGITDQDINDYFEYAPMESITSLLDEFDKLMESQRYSLLTNSISTESLSFIFQRVPIDDLLKLFDLIRPQEKLDILKRIPQESLQSFVSDLSTQDFAELFKDMEKSQISQLKISETENALDAFYEKLGHQSYLGERSQEFSDMNMQQLDALAVQREQALQHLRIIPRHELQPHETSRLTEAHLPSTRIPIIQPVNIRRSLQSGSVSRYVSEHSKDIARGVVRSGVHGVLP